MKFSPSLFIKNKIINPLLDLLKQGLTVKKMSQALAVGFVVACFPVLGLTSILCVVVATLFRLNHVAIQIANYVAYPLQLLLIIPFLHFGNSLFGLPAMDLNLQDLLVQFQIDPGGFFKIYGLVAMRACVAWALIAPFAIAIVYYPTRWLVQRISLKFVPRGTDEKQISN